MSHLSKPALARTLDRIAAMRRLVDLMRAGAMTRDDICGKMGISPSGCRKYANQMIDGGIVAVSYLPSGFSGGGGQAVYTLIGTDEQIERFFQTADAVKPKCNAPRHPMAAAPGRRFHILADDAHYAIRLDRRPAFRDPLALPPAFFRPVEARA